MHAGNRQFHRCRLPARFLWRYSPRGRRLRDWPRHPAKQTNRRAMPVERGQAERAVPVSVLPRGIGLDTQQECQETVVAVGRRHHHERRTRLIDRIGVEAAPDQFDDHIRPVVPDGGDSVLVSACGGTARRRKQCKKTQKKRCRTSKWHRQGRHRKDGRSSRSSLRQRLSEKFPSVRQCPRQRA